MVFLCVDKRRGMVSRIIIFSLFLNGCVLFTFYWSMWLSGRQIFIRMKNVTKPENMFFFETSGRCHLTTREACSIESAAKHHPTNRIQFLYACKNVSQLKDDKPFQIVSQIENVEVKSLNFKFVLSGTPLANWYESGILNITIKKNNVLSDGLKFVLLKKYGGVAIDSDCITRKPLPNLPAYAGFQTLSVVNNAIIKAQKDSPFLIECMERFVKEYSPTIWCHNGPKLLTRVIQGACEKENKYFAPGFTCYGVHLFPLPAFYPINFSQRKLFFDPSVSESLNEIWKDSYIVHIWNSLVQRQQYKPGEGSPMDHLYKDNCPLTYSYIVKQGVGE